MDRPRSSSIDREAAWSAPQRRRHRSVDREMYDWAVSEVTQPYRHRSVYGGRETVPRPACSREVRRDEAHHAESTRSSAVVTSFRGVHAIMSPPRPRFARCRRPTIFVIFCFYCKPEVRRTNRRSAGLGGGSAPSLAAVPRRESNNLMQTGFCPGGSMTVARGRSDCCSERTITHDEIVSVGAAG